MIHSLNKNKSNKNRVHTFATECEILIADLTEKNSSQFFIYPVPFSYFLYEVTYKKDLNNAYMFKHNRSGIYIKKEEERYAEKQNIIDSYFMLKIAHLSDLQRSQLPNDLYLHILVCA